MSDPETPQTGPGALLPDNYVRDVIAFLVNAHAATVNMRLYPPTSTMVTDTFSKARDALTDVFDTSESLSIATVENNLLVDEVRLDDLEQQKAPIKSFVAWMTERGLSNIEFRKGLTGEELQTFFSVLSGVTDAADRARMSEELGEQGVEHIHVNQRVYVAVNTSETGEIIGGVQGSSAPLDALKDELLMRYLMGKVDLGDVEDRELVQVLSDPGKVGGLLSRFLGEEGTEGSVLMRSEKAEEALDSLAELVNQIDDEGLRDAMSDQITSVIAEMSPREMTSVLSGKAPETLDIRHIRENVITMLSDNRLLDIIDSLIDEYIDMKGETGELETEWTRERLADLNELLMEVRKGDKAGAISEAIDKKLDEAGISEERDPHTGKRILSAYEMLGGPIEEGDIQLEDGVDQTVPRQIRQLYAMEESDLAAGMLLKVLENLRQESPAVRRFAAGLIRETLEGLDEEHGLQAVDVVRPRMVEDLAREDDYETFVREVDSAAIMAELYMKSGRGEDASSILDVLVAVSNEDSDKGEELVKRAGQTLSNLMGPEGMINVEELLLEEDPEKRLKTIQTLANLGPSALTPLVDMVKDRGQIEMRDLALEAIQAAGEPGITALLGELEKDNQWYVYRNILNVVADLKLVQGLPQVTAMVSNPDERIRREAVRSLARIGSRESLDVVKGAANDQSIAVRRTAVRVLGLFGDPSVAPFLLDIIHGTGLRGKDEDQSVVEAACLSIGDLRDPSNAPQLIELLGKGGLFKKGRPDEIRAAACIALGNIGDASAIPALERMAKDPSVVVRGSAEKALRRLKGEVSVPEPLGAEEIAEVAGHPERAPIAPGMARPVEPLERPEEPVLGEGTGWLAAGAPEQAPAQPAYREPQPQPIEPVVREMEPPPAAPHTGEAPTPAAPQQTMPPAPQARPFEPVQGAQPPRPFEPMAPPEPPPGFPPAQSPAAEPGPPAEVPPEVKKLWPEGSLNGHDYPVPPPPDQEGNSPAEMHEGLEPDEQAVDLPPDDFAPGRLDQPSTMERLLGQGRPPESDDPG